MPEGVAVAGGPVVSGAVHDDPDRPPAPGPDAPKGWTWNRSERYWQPKQRGPVRWVAPGSSGVRDAPDATAEAAGGSEDYGRDPAPGWHDAEEPPKQRVDPADVPDELKADVASFAHLLAAPVLALAKTADPYCGAILADNFADILDTAMPILVRSPRVVKFFTAADSDWLLWLKLAMVLGPVAQAIAQHHVLGTVKVVRGDDGTVTILRGREAVDAHQRGEPLQPQPQPEYKYAA